MPDAAPEVVDEQAAVGDRDVAAVLLPSDPSDAGAVAPDDTDGVALMGAPCVQSAFGMTGWLGSSNGDVTHLGHSSRRKIHRPCCIRNFTCANQAQILKRLKQTVVRGVTQCRGAVGLLGLDRTRTGTTAGLMVLDFIVTAGAVTRARRVITSIGVAHRLGGAAGLDGSGSLSYL